MNIFIGIDPGVSGGIAIITETGRVLEAVAMPETDGDVLLTLGRMNVENLTGTSAVRPRAMLERVWSSPGWGHVGAFKFGLSYGGLRMALAASHIPFDEPLPRAWQASLGVVYSREMKATQKKNITKGRAQQLFPEVSMKHAIADALLIAEFCRRTHAPQAPQTKGRR